MTNTKQNLRVTDLNTQGPTAFELHPSVAQRKAIAKQLDLVELRKIRFIGQITPAGDADWHLTGDLGATVVQPCVITLTPVATRIDIQVTRQFMAHIEYPDEAEEEIEVLPGEDSEPLGNHIDLVAVMSEALSLALPPYPKADGATLETSTFTEDGKTPMSDEAARPFAALSSLRDKLGRDKLEKDGE
ncbi:YceD family protein [Profundibacter sp.]